MPLYEYDCTTCHATWEHEARITDPPQRVCPKCQQETARRLISAGGGFELRGEGWFAKGGY